MEFIFLGLCISTGLMGFYVLIITQIEKYRS